jgi:hypothetical protein
MINKFEDEQNPQKFQFVDNKLLDVFENITSHHDSSAEAERVFNKFQEEYGSDEEVEE